MVFVCDNPIAFQVAKNVAKALKDRLVSSYAFF